MKKKIFILSFLISLLALLIYLKLSLDEEVVDLKEVKVDLKTHKKKVAKQPPSLFLERPKSEKKRVLQGYLQEKETLRSINKIDPNWMDLLAKRLQWGDLQVKITHLESIYRKEGAYGRYIEKVKVVTTVPNRKKNPSSYIALVDSQTGQVIDTWGGY